MDTPDCWCAIVPMARLLASWQGFGLRQGICDDIVNLETSREITSPAQVQAHSQAVERCTNSNLTAQCNLSHDNTV